MSEKKCCGGGCHSKATPDPASPNYTKDVKNKANQKSPFGENEPSTETTYK